MGDMKKGEEKTVADAEPTVSRKDQRKLDAERRQRNKPLYEALKKAELAVEKYHNEQRQLEQMLADPDIYTDDAKIRLKQTLEKKVQVDKALEEAETAWMAAEEAIENAE